MPLYEYQCQANRHRFEVRQSIHDDPVATCPECGAPVRRVIHPVGIVFKGSGFYATDSRKPESKPAEPKTEVKSEGKSEGKSESKPDTSPKSDTSGQRSSEK